MAVVKYHVNDEGNVGKCGAKNSCPFGGETGFEDHYATPEEAKKAYEKKMEGNSGSSSSLKSDPNTKHLSKIKRALAQNAADFKARDAWRDKTLEKELEAKFSREEIDELLNMKIFAGESTIGYGGMNKNSDKFYGVTFSPNPKFEEEEALRKLHKALEDGDVSPDEISIVEKDGKTSLIINPYGHEGYAVERSFNEANRQLNNYFPPKRFDAKWKLERNSLVELKSMAKAAGIKPMPTRRAEIVNKLLDHQLGETTLRTPQASYGEGMGEVLTITTDNKVMAEALKRVKSANDNGTLRIGSARNPFSRGVLFYDDRDMSSDDKAQMIKDNVVAEELSKRIEPSVDALRKVSRNGVLVRPSSNGDLKDLSEGKYWVDFRAKNLDHDKYLSRDDNVYGYFNEKEINDMANGDYTALSESNKEKKAQGYSY